ncbi:hypothetical protein LCGC14_2513350, partial [marine sediment metagenome]
MRTRNVVLLWIVAAAALGCGTSASLAGLAEAPDPGSLLHLDLPALKGLADADWGPTRTDGGRACRSAKAGRQARIEVPVWWGKTPRPPEGTVYV